MGSLLSSTLNTRALPVDGMPYRYIRSDAPLNLTKEEIQWLLDNNITTEGVKILVSMESKSF